ncbi:MAG: hypothetical protein J5742_01660 [Alphaproteobacteria bacterium]|nr:hypothetical protein [Alphaproteobacteria bacterium]
MKNTVLFCTGFSGSGKTYFINKTLPEGLFYNLRSATTRDMRDGEKEGEKYFFRNEEYFKAEPLVTYLWVNENFWKPGERKWLYGVPESEVLNNIGRNFVYDVIEPKYIRQMIDWFTLKKLDREYGFKIAWFIPPKNNFEIAAARATMPNDTAVRKANTCDAGDFLDYNLRPDYILRPITGHMDARLMQYIGALYDDMMYTKRKTETGVHIARRR